MNICSINILKYIYTKQNKSNLTITQNTQLQSQNQGKKKNTNHHKTTNKGSELINLIKNKNKNYNPSNNTYHKIHKSNQRAKEKKKIASFIHKPP